MAIGVTIAGGITGSASALAACGQGEATVFECLSQQGKRIQVCDAGQTINYSFGLPNTKPEMLVRAPRERASTYQWRGVGRAIHYSIDVPHGDTIYRVFWSFDRLSEIKAVEAGVEVEIAKKNVATVRCAGERHIVQNIEGIKLRPSE